MEDVTVPEETPGTSAEGSRDFYGGEVAMCWDMTTTKLLIDLFKTYWKEVGTLKIKTMWQMWRLIADELSELTKRKITEQNCENRWRVLDSNYKNYVDNKNSTRSERNIFEYAGEMADLFSSKRDVHPVLVLSTETIVHEKPSKRTVIGTTGLTAPSGHKIIRRTNVTRRASILEQMRQDRLDYQTKRLEQEERKIALLERKVLLLEKQASRDNSS